MSSSGLILELDILGLDILGRTPSLVLIPNPNAVPKSECVSALITQSLDTLLDLRTCCFFFNHADLVTPGDELVSC